jgi:hypothetical protein
MKNEGERDAKNEAKRSHFNLRFTNADLRTEPVGETPTGTRGTRVLPMERGFCQTKPSCEFCKCLEPGRIRRHESQSDAKNEAISQMQSADPLGGLGAGCRVRNAGTEAVLKCRMQKAE